jgi:hypothetical protein
MHDSQRVPAAVVEQHWHAIGNDDADCNVSVAGHERIGLGETIEARIQAPTAVHAGYYNYCRAVGLPTERQVAWCHAGGVQERAPVGFDRVLIAVASVTDASLMWRTLIATAHPVPQRKRAKRTEAERNGRPTHLRSLAAG